MASRAPVFSVEGGKELRRALKEAEGDLDDMKSAHVAVADFVIDFANSRGLTPVRTGAMRATQRAQKLGASAGIRVGSARVRYAPFVYYGTRKMPGNPWLQKAAVQSEEQWLAVYDRYVADALAKAVAAL